MKIRNGFVSNSSSSSFVCDLCGERFEGMDACPSDFDCSVCDNEHIICNEHLVGKDGCPICCFEDYSEREMSQYLEKTRGIPRDEVFAKVKAINKRRKKLYEAEYISYVCEKFELTDDLLLKEVKEKFDNFDSYYDFINGK